MAETLFATLDKIRVKTPKHASKRLQIEAWRIHSRHCWATLFPLLPRTSSLIRLVLRFISVFQPIDSQVILTYRNDTFLMATFEQLQY